MRIFGQVGSRNGERVQDDALDAAAGEPSAENMAGFVDDLHTEPRGKNR